MSVILAVTALTHCILAVFILGKARYGKYLQEIYAAIFLRTWYKILKNVRYI